MSSLKKPPSNTHIILFVVALSFACALILSVLASALSKPQQIAKELDQSKQMLIAARILNPNGFFQVQNDEGEYIPAYFEQGKGLLPGKPGQGATDAEVLAIFRKRIRPILVNNQGNISTFEKEGINQKQYLKEFRKTGYYKQPWKLIYEILPQEGDKESDTENIVGYVIPINGYGLWDAIYGFLAIQPNGDTVVGISWYDQKETPGLGANITDPAWQKQFFDKEIFQESPSGSTDFATAPLGITVVKGKVSEVLGNSPKAKSAVDGIVGATLTGNGVTQAYKDVLHAYRPFLMQLNKKSEEK